VERAEAELAKGIKRKRKGRPITSRSSGRSGGGGGGGGGSGDEADQPAIIPWSKVARHVPGRTDPQCRERWTGALDPSLNRMPWSEQEKNDLRALMTSMGVDVAAAGSRKWSEVAIALDTGRTDSQVRKQWKQLEHKRQKAEERERTELADGQTRGGRGRGGGRGRRRRQAVRQQPQAVIADSEALASATAGAEGPAAAAAERPATQQPAAQQPAAQQPAGVGTAAAVGALLPLALPVPPP
jgi:hypothetical protein